LLGVEEPGGRRDTAPDLELRRVVATITGGRRAAAPFLVLVTHHELRQGIATIPLGPSGILQLACMGLEEPGGRRDPAPDLELQPVVATITRGTRAVAPDLVLVAQLELLQVIERRSRAPDYVPVTFRKLLLGMEEPGGRRNPAPDRVLVAELELRQSPSGILHLSLCIVKCENRIAACPMLNHGSEALQMNPQGNTTLIVDANDAIPSHKRYERELGCLSTFKVKKKEQSSVPVVLKRGALTRENRNYFVINFIFI
jgi:hypothetical protein